MMNERIKELVLEAAYGNIDPNGPFTPEEFNNFTVKFAELIVRECQTVVEWAISVDSTIDRVPVLIREHFGVEE
jgi:hypothetical protein